MEERPNPLHCRDNDVIAFGDSTFKVGKLKEAIRKSFGHEIGYGLMTLLGNQGVQIEKSAISPDGDKSEFARWFTEGIDCEVLKTDVPGWQKGKVKVSVSIVIELADPPMPRASGSQPTPPSVPQWQEPELDEHDATVHADMWGDE